MTTRITFIFTLAGLAGCADSAPKAAPVSTPTDSLGLAENILFLRPEQQVPRYRHMDQASPFRVFQRGATVHPLPKSASPLLDVRYQIAGQTLGIDSFMVRNHVTGLLILKDGKILDERYRLGNDESTKWISFSVGKSFVSTLVGAAVQDGAIASIEDPLDKYLPDLKGSAYEGVTIRQAMQMASGIKYNEDYRDPAADIAKVTQCLNARKPGCVFDVMKGLPRVGPAGTIYNYNTGETHLVGLVVQAATGKTLSAYLAEKIWQPFGMESDGYWLLESDGGQEFAGGSVNATLRDYGRFGQFILDGGQAAGRRVLPEGWVAEASHPRADSPANGYGKLYPDYPLGYGYFWWSYPKGARALPNHDGAFEGEGIFGQTLYLNPAERLVAVIWSAWPEPDAGPRWAEDRAFLGGVVEAARAVTP